MKDSTKPPFSTPKPLTVLCLAYAQESDKLVAYQRNAKAIMEAPDNHLISEWRADLTECFALYIADIEKYQEAINGLSPYVYIRDKTPHASDAVRAILSVWLDKICRGFDAGSNNPTPTRLTANLLPKALTTEFKGGYSTDLKTAIDHFLSHYDFDELLTRITELEGSIEALGLQTASDYLARFFNFCYTPNIKLAAGRIVVQTSRLEDIYYNDSDVGYRVDGHSFHACTLHNARIASGAFGVDSGTVTLGGVFDLLAKAENEGGIESRARFGVGSDCFVSVFNSAYKFHFTPALFESLLAFICTHTKTDIELDPIVASMAA